MPFSPAAFDQAEYLEAAPAAFDSALFTRALAFGLAGAVAGALLYAAFIGITHIEIGYLSIGVAYLVARAMTVGSRERGGRPYQIAAMVLTLCAVAAGNALLLWWTVTHQGEPVPLTLHNLFLLLRFGFEKPFLELKSSTGGAVLGFFILFLGLRAAWRMTSGLPGASRHPFSR